MVIQFDNTDLEALYQGLKLKGKPHYNKTIVSKFVKTIKMMAHANSIAEIKLLKGLNFEALKGNLKGKYSVRVDQKYRIILRLEKDKLTVVDVIVIEDLTNHYQ